MLTGRRIRRQLNVPILRTQAIESSWPQPNGDWSLDSKTVAIAEARWAMASGLVLAGG